MFLLIQKIIGDMKLPITRRSIRDTLLSHPLYPTLSSISDAFDEWKVKHVITKINLKMMQELELTAITETSEYGIVYITKISNGEVRYMDSAHNHRKMPVCDFEHIWSGISIIIEDVSDAIEENHEERRRKEIKSSAILYLGGLSFIILSILLLYLNTTILTISEKIVLLFNNFTGAVVSLVFYAQKRLSVKFPLGDFCKKGKIIDCDTVFLSTKKSSWIFQNIIEFSTAYFSSICMLLIVEPLDDPMRNSIYLIILLSPPVIIWSFITQTFILKKICSLCCVILCNLIVNILFVRYPISSLDIAVLLKFGLFFSSIVLVLANIRYGYNVEKEKYSLIRQLRKVKLDYRTIMAHLSNRKIETPRYGFIFGNESSRTELAFIVSLRCNHCVKLVSKLLWYKDIYPNIKYNIVYNVDENDDVSCRIVSYLYALYKANDYKKFISVLESVLLNPKSRVDEPGSSNEILSLAIDYNLIDSQKEFCTAANADYYPAIFVNGKQLSNLYGIRDMSSLIQLVSKA